MGRTTNLPPSAERYIHSRYLILAVILILFPFSRDPPSCQLILRGAGCDGYRVGKTKVFLKQRHSDKLGLEVERSHRAATVLQKGRRSEASSCLAVVAVCLSLEVLLLLL